MDAREIQQIAEKALQNEQEKNDFEVQLHEMIHDNSETEEVLTIGSMPNVLIISGAELEQELTISKEMLDKTVRPENESMTERTEQTLNEQQLAEVLDSVKTPVMMMQGDREDSLVVVSDKKDDKENQILLEVALDKDEQQASVIAISSFDKPELSELIEQKADKGEIIALHEEKAEEFQKLIDRIGTIPDMQSLKEDAELSKQSGSNEFSFRHQFENGRFIDYDFARSNEDTIHIVALEDYQMDSSKVQEIIFEKDDLHGTDVGEMPADYFRPDLEHLPKNQTENHKMVQHDNISLD
ncbi:MAG: hypothetical protein V3G42_10420 [Oscillospiraceae bacterium]